MKKCNEFIEWNCRVIWWRNR